MFCFWIFCGCILYLKTQLHCLSLPISAGGRSRVERRRSLRHRCHCYILCCYLLLFISYLYLYFFAASLHLYILTFFLLLFISYLYFFAASLPLLHPSCLLLLLFRPCFVFGLCIYGWEFLWVFHIGISIFKLILRSSPSSFHSKLPLKYCSKMDRLFLLNTVCVLSRSMAYRWEPFYLVLILYSN